MDINTVRGLHTILVMAIFIGIVWWAYSAHRKKSNEESAQLPFADEDIDRRTREKDLEKKEDE
ncbi:cbb3-type cytochrome c oxidase subunit 3 [Marinobacteraceae bacterium S3BR75-40.1]